MSAIIIPFPARPRLGSDDNRRGHGRRTRPHPVAARFNLDGLAEQSEEVWFRQANHVLDQVESMVSADDRREVRTLCEQAVWCLLDAAPEIDDGCAVMSLVDRLRDLHLRACQFDPPDPADLAVFVYRLAASQEMGVLHGVIDPYAALLGKSGLAAIRRMLADDERRVSHAPGIARSILELRLRPIRASLARADHPSAV